MQTNTICFHSELDHESTLLMLSAPILHEPNSIMTATQSLVNLVKQLTYMYM